MIIDTLKLKTKLEHAGMDDQIAVTIADALGNADFDQLATKTDLKTEIDTLRTDIQTEITSVRAEIATLKADIQTQITSVKTDFQTQITTLKADLQTQISSVKADIADVKTDLYKALYKALWIQWGSIVAAVSAIAAISKLF